MYQAAPKRLHNERVAVNNCQFGRTCTTLHSLVNFGHNVSKWSFSETFLQIGKIGTFWHRNSD